MKNNAHLGESKEARLKRFQANGPNEAILTLLNSIDNFFNNEIRYIVNQETQQTSLMLIGIHAAILTIAEAFYGKSGLKGYTRFLKDFVDQELPNQKFSTIAKELHDWRNIIAHQWLSAKGHNFGYAFTIDEGWKREDDVLYINPAIYAKQYLGAFVGGGKIWDYRDLFSTEELTQIQQRIINKFVRE